MTDDLPEGWVDAQVCDLMRLQNGFPFKPTQWRKTGLPIVWIQNLNNPGAPFNHCDDALPEKFRVSSGDLLFAWSGTPGTSFGAHIWNGGNAWLNQHIFRVDFDESFLDKRYLKLAINRNLDEYIHQAHGGAGLAHITKAKFDASFLRLPPLTEQRRIVAKVEELLARVNVARERLAKVPAILKRFRQSVLAAACDGQLTADWRDTGSHKETGDKLISQIASERRLSSVKRRIADDDEDASSEAYATSWELPSSWCWAKLKDLLHYERSAAYGVLQSGANVRNGVPFVRICDLQSGTVSKADLKHIAIGIDKQYPRTKLRGNEVLVTLVGTIGRTAVVPEWLAGANVARAVGVLPLCPHVLPEFVRLTLDHLPKNKELNDLAREVARKTLNLGLLKAVEIPIPPYAEQIEIIRRVDNLFALADKIEARVQAATQRVEKITQAILAKAFRGKLVPTEAELARQEGRDYEPASVLLERIRAARATASSNFAPRKRRSVTGVSRSTPNGRRQAGKGSSLRGQGKL